MFKQIKRKLVADKKLKNYTLYAIGETLLIVIGILVAMNINNWNENKKNLKQSKYFIDEIAVDLQRDTSYLNMALKRIDLKVEYKGKLLYPDSLQNFSTINIQHIISSGTNNININTGTFDKMRESGVLSLEENKYLFQKLSYYYTSFKKYLDLTNDWEQKLVEKEHDQWFYQNDFELTFMDNSEAADPKLNRTNMLNILQSNRGKNLLKMSIMRENTMKDTYEKTVKNAERLLHIIDSLKQG